ncbi:hypothetical protein CEXT_361231 [Caerostris extrusa]|uniref:Uncharacterized protein n=1 Tax=Caerostris extrusa TaxID=172846 RepID=A0AAV4TST9_CAEEX|nr:hypothetical protein CEXT_361231 [Caerostris extrusa]
MNAKGSFEVFCIFNQKEFPFLQSRRSDQDKHTALHLHVLSSQGLQVSPDESQILHLQPERVSVSSEAAAPIRKTHSPTFACCLLNGWKYHQMTPPGTKAHPQKPPPPYFLHPLQNECFDKSPFERQLVNEKSLNGCTDFLLNL